MTPLLKKDAKKWTPLLNESLAVFGNILSCNVEYQAAVKVFEQARVLALEYDERTLANLLYDLLQKIKLA